VDHGVGYGPWVSLLYDALPELDHLIVETAALYNSTTMLLDSRRICYDIAVHPMLMDSV
jgi:hypothetical protein